MEITIQKEKVGDVKLTIQGKDSTRIIIEYENQKVAGFLTKVDGNDVVKFYVFKPCKAAGKKINGFNITKDDAERIKKVQEEQKDIIDTQEVNEFLKAKKVVYHTYYKFLIPSKLNDMYGKEVQEITYNNIKDKYKYNLDCGDYSMEYYFEITGEELIKELDKGKLEQEEKDKEQEEKDKKAKEKREKEIEKLAKEAKETNENVVIDRCMSDCNDISEECNLDIVYKLITPEGKIIIERYHTY